MIREIYSRNRRFRARVFKDERRGFSVETEAFYDDHGLQEWESTASGLHLYDSESAAVIGAKELLRNEAGDDGSE